MQHESYGFTLARDDDLLHRDAKETFLVLWGTARVIPKSGEIARQLQQLTFLRFGEWALPTVLQAREFGFQLRLCGQCLIPAAFELRRNQPIRRIYGIILTARVCHFIMRVL